jgi:hypothetical protein
MTGPRANQRVQAFLQTNFGFILCWQYIYRTWRQKSLYGLVTRLVVACFAAALPALATGGTPVLSASSMSFARRSLKSRVSVVVYRASKPRAEASDWRSEILRSQWEVEHSIKCEFGVFSSTTAILRRFKQFKTSMPAAAWSPANLGLKSGSSSRSSA